MGFGKDDKGNAQDFTALKNIAENLKIFCNGKYLDVLLILLY